MKDIEACKLYAILPPLQWRLDSGFQKEDCGLKAASFCFRLFFFVAEVGRSVMNKVGSCLKRRGFHGFSSVFSARTDCFLFFKEFLSLGAG